MFFKNISQSGTDIKSIGVFVELSWDFRLENKLAKAEK